MVQRDEHGHPLPGQALNPKGKGGFQDRPEDAAKGRWKATDTPGYWLKKFNTMTIAEFKEFTQKPSTELTVPQFEAMQLHLAGMRDMEKSKHGLDAFREIMDRVEGKARQTIDTTIQNYAPPTINIVVSDDNPEEHDAASHDDAD